MLEYSIIFPLQICVKLLDLNARFYHAQVPWITKQGLTLRELAGLYCYKISHKCLLDWLINCCIFQYLPAHVESNDQLKYWYGYSIQERRGRSCATYKRATALHLKHYRLLSCSCDISWGVYLSQVSNQQVSLQFSILSLMINELSPCIHSCLPQNLETFSRALNDANKDWTLIFLRFEDIYSTECILSTLSIYLWSVSLGTITLSSLWSHLDDNYNSCKIIRVLIMRLVMSITRQ